MAGAHEIRGAGVAVGDRAHRIGALLRGNSRGQTVAHVDRNGECGAERRIIERDHRIEMQTPRLVRAERGADNARGVADDERHLLRRAQARRDEQVALVLAVVVIGDDNDFAARKGGDGGADVLVAYRLPFGSASLAAQTAMPAFRRPGRAGADNGPQSRTPPWPRRSARPGCRRTGRGGLWWKSRYRGHSGRRCGAGLRIDEVGLTAKRATIDCPVEMPPRMPPALLDRNTGLPSLPMRISSAFSSPESAAAPKPAPISTPLTALMPISAAARSPSSLP